MLLNWIILVLPFAVLQFYLGNGNVNSTKLIENREKRRHMIPRVSRTPISVSTIQVTGTEAVIETKTKTKTATETEITIETKTKTKTETESTTKTVPHTVTVTVTNTETSTATKNDIEGEAKTELAETKRSTKILPDTTTSTVTRTFTKTEAVKEAGARVSPLSSDAEAKSNQKAQDKNVPDLTIEEGVQKAESHPWQKTTACNWTKLSIQLTTDHLPFPLNLTYDTYLNLGSWIADSRQAQQIHLDLTAERGFKEVSRALNAATEYLIDQPLTYMCAMLQHLQSQMATFNSLKNGAAGRPKIEDLVALADRAGTTAIAEHRDLIGPPPDDIQVALAIEVLQAWPLITPGDEEKRKVCFRNDCRIADQISSLQIAIDDKRELLRDKMLQLRDQIQQSDLYVNSFSWLAVAKMVGAYFILVYAANALAWRITWYSLATIVWFGTILMRGFGDNSHEMTFLYFSGFAAMVVAFLYECWYIPPWAVDVFERDP
ncbi:hypothetical protein F5Y16DRAFT_34962 [Xylariaceae sp. FL0255]|nr:hypothetical protein F5Y16DRAFT_34962 [Xylariaceae sp. FL0255]